MTVTIYGSTPLCWALVVFQFLNPIHSRQDSLDRGSARRKASTDRTTQTQNKRTQTSVLPVGFELTIPVLERPKTIHALDNAATVIGSGLM
jgi:hypothetical protein